MIAVSTQLHSVATERGSIQPGSQRITRDSDERRVNNNNSNNGSSRGSISALECEEYLVDSLGKSQGSNHSQSSFFSDSNESKTTQTKRDRSVNPAVVLGSGNRKNIAGTATGRLRRSTSSGGGGGNDSSSSSDFYPGSLHRRSPPGSNSSMHPSSPSKEPTYPGSLHRRSESTSSLRSTGRSYREKLLQASDGRGSGRSSRTMKSSTSINAADGKPMERSKSEGDFKAKGVSNGGKKIRRRLKQDASGLDASGHSAGSSIHRRRLKYAKSVDDQNWSSVHGDELTLGSVEENPKVGRNSPRAKGNDRRTTMKKSQSTSVIPEMRSSVRSTARTLPMDVPKGLSSRSLRKVLIAQQALAEKNAENSSQDDDSDTIKSSSKSSHDSISIGRSGHEHSQRGSTHKKRTSISKKLLGVSMDKESSRSMKDNDSRHSHGQERSRRSRRTRSAIDHTEEETEQTPNERFIVKSKAAMESEQDARNLASFTSLPPDLDEFLVSQANATQHFVVKTPATKSGRQIKRGSLASHLARRAQMEERQDSGNMSDDAKSTQSAPEPGVKHNARRKARKGTLVKFPRSRSVLQLEVNVLKENFESNGYYANNLVLVNNERKQESLTPLNRNVFLDETAAVYAKRMADSLGGDIIETPLVVNVMRGPSVRAMHASLMKMENTRSNILNPTFRQFGMATCKGEDDNLYLCQVFAQAQNVIECVDYQ